METTAQKALRLLSEVPKEQFIVDDFTDNIGKCCAIGHYQRLTSKNPNDYSRENCDDSYIEIEDSPIRTISEKFLLKYGMGYSYLSIANINNKPNINGYTEPEIKDRVIHLLEDMVAEGL